MGCWSAWLNLIAAILSTIGAGLGAAALWLAPDPTFLTKLGAVGATAATLGGIAWIISAAIALRDCLKSEGGDQATIDRLESEIQRLQQEVDKLKGH